MVQYTLYTYDKNRLKHAISSKKLRIQQANVQKFPFLTIPLSFDISLQLTPVNICINIILVEIHQKRILGYA